MWCKLNIIISYEEKLLNKFLYREKKLWNLFVITNRVWRYLIKGRATLSQLMETQLWNGFKNLNPLVFIFIDWKITTLTIVLSVINNNKNELPHN